MLGQATRTYSAQVAGTVVNLDANMGVVIRSLVLVNTTAALAYVQIFKKPAAGVTLGTTTPDLVIPLLASGGVSLSDVSMKIPGTGVSLAATTTRTGAVGATVDVFAAIE